MKGPPANAGDSVSIPGPGRSPGGGRGNPLQRSRLENPSHGQRSLVGLWPTGPPKIRPGCFRSGWFLSGIAVTCNVPLHLCAVHISICLELRSSRPPLLISPCSRESHPLDPVSLPRGFPPTCLYFTRHGRIFDHVLGFLESTSLKVASCLLGSSFPGGCREK